tara:strand:+ start:279 stop:911 length:633 start_codon:yes stop_codon:yes gene_type:complete
VDALFDSWDPDRSGAIEMSELCKRLRCADVQKGAVVVVSPPESPSPSRHKSSVSAALVQQKNNLELERDRKMGSQRKMGVAARATARREVDRQLMLEVTKLYAVYLQRCTYAAYAPRSRSPASPHSHLRTLTVAPSHSRWIYRNSPTNTGTFENVLRISYPDMSQGRRTEMMARAKACYAVRQQANDRAEVERCVRVTTRTRPLPTQPVA